MKDSQSATARRAAVIYGLAMLLALVGLGDSLYLKVQHLTGKSVKCSVTSGCSAVLSSAYATVAGVPTAALGLLAYFIAFSLATLALFGHAWARTALTWLVVPMVLTTLWLLHVQAFVLHAFCQYCLLSAALTFLLAALVGAARLILPAAKRSPM
jgi:uncharacterized membrane protein